eukprot:4089795-Prymnesium_polylepis.1
MGPRARYARPCNDTPPRRRARRHARSLALAVVLPSRKWYERELVAAQPAFCIAQVPGPT